MNDQQYAPLAQEIERALMTVCGHLKQEGGHDAPYLLSVKERLRAAFCDIIALEESRVRTEKRQFIGQET